MYGSIPAVFEKAGSELLKTHKSKKPAVPEN